MLVKISFDRNKELKQECVMDDTDCKRIAKDANINYESSIDIFYNDGNVFPKYESNMEAVEQLKLFCSKRCE